MRYLSVLAACAAVALVVVGTGTGARAEQITIHIDDHIDADALTDACGVEVDIDIVADLKVTLIRNKEGLVVREIDAAFGDGTFTYSSPERGTRFRSPPTSTWDYGDGAVVGSEVLVMFTGLQGHVPGLIATDAGLVRIVGLVTGFDEFGIPQVDFPNPPLSDRGNQRAATTSSSRSARAWPNQLRHGRGSASRSLVRPGGGSPGQETAEAWKLPKRGNCRCGPAGDRFGASGF